VTEWEQFRALDFTRLARIMANKVLIDLRNVYRGEEAFAAGFQYDSIGRVHPR
jgi:UDPglucose 6-dehydrogenase